MKLIGRCNTLSARVATDRAEFLRMLKMGGPSAGWKRASFSSNTEVFSSYSRTGDDFAEMMARSSRLANSRCGEDHGIPSRVAVRARVARTTSRISIMRVWLRLRRMRARRRASSSDRSTGWTQVVIRAVSSPFTRVVVRMRAVSMETGVRGCTVDAKLPAIVAGIITSRMMAS